MNKIRPIKNPWYDWLISYIPRTVIKIIGGFKDKIVSFLNTKKIKQIVYGRGKKLSKNQKHKNNLKKI